MEDEDSNAAILEVIELMQSDIDEMQKRIDGLSCESEIKKKQITLNTLKKTLEFIDGIV